MLRPILVMIWLGWSLLTPAVYGCSLPQPPVNGLVLELSGYPWTVRFVCDGGYYLNGTITAVCDTVRGEWIPANPPKCEQRTACPPLQPPVNGFTLDFDEHVNFECVGGYIRNGSYDSICDAEQGVWDPPPPTCEPSPYCPPLEPLLNGHTMEGYGDELKVEFLCYGGYTLNGSFKSYCDPEAGVWYPPPPRCELVPYCSPPEQPVNGFAIGGQFGTVEFGCHYGYTLNGSAIATCDALLGVWDSPPPFCELQNCSPPEPPVNGFARRRREHETVEFGCNDNYTLNGSAIATCDAVLGVWDSPPPFCELQKAPPIGPCPSVLDDLGIFWNETLPGTQAVVDCIHLQDDLAGVISRSCSLEGGWRTPLYNCVRDTLATVLEEIEQLLENPTNSSVEVALSKLANATSETDSLFEGEIKLIVELLETIVDYIDATSSVTETEDFFSITDDLLGRDNEPAWKRLIETPGEQEGGFVVLRLIEQFAENLVDDLAEGQSRTLAGENVDLQIVKLHSHNDDNDDILYPSENGLATSDSYLYLPKTSLVGSTAYIAATYKHLTGILPDTYQGVHTGDLDLNSVVLTLTLLPNSPTALQDPIRLTYEHLESDKSDPTCSFWDYNRSSWSSDGCELVSTSEKISTCECDHLTNFALLMSPLAKPVDTLAISIITYVGCCLSCLFLIVTIGSHVFLWRYVKADRVVILINLSTALIISYLVFLAGIRQTVNKVMPYLQDACTAVAVILQYMYLVVFFLMLAESIEIAVTVLHVFPTRSRLPWMIPLTWAIPAVIVAISAGAVRLDGYGNSVFCWLSTETSLIWAFAGPALVIILINIVILIFVMRAMFKTEAIKRRSTKAKAKTGIRCLCVLVPLMGLSWVLGIFYVSERLAWIQYVFAVCNSLQGVVIFIFHCLFNEKIRSAFRRRRMRLGDYVPKSSSDSKLDKRLTMLDCVTFCNPHKTHASTTADSAGSASQTIKSKSKTAGDASVADDTLSLSAQQSDPATSNATNHAPGTVPTASDDAITTVSLNIKSKAKRAEDASLADDALSLSAPQSDPATSNATNHAPGTVPTAPDDAITVPGDSDAQPVLLKQATETPMSKEADKPRLQEAVSLNIVSKSKRARDASLADDALSLSAQQSDPATSNATNHAPATLPTVPGDAVTIPGDSDKQSVLLKQAPETPMSQEADKPRLQEAVSLNVKTKTSSNA